MNVIYSEYIEKEGQRYPNPQFKALDKAIASNEDKEIDDIIYYYGSDEEILDLGDYNEYGWEFIVDKYKYNSDFLLNYISDGGKGTIGDKLEDISKVSRVLFPTLAKNDSDVKNNIKYFGSITIGKQKLIMVNVLKGYSTLKLFDTTIDDSVPRIVITFSEKEIGFNKIVWFVITSGGKSQVLDINLSYFSWENSINPHRNMNNYLVRRDEFSNTLASLDIFGNLKKNIEDPLYVDLSSNTIVGNKKVDIFPIGSSFILLDSKGEENSIGIVYEGDKKLYKMEDFCIGIKTEGTIKLAAKYKNVSFTAKKLLISEDIWQGEFEATAGYVERLINTYKYPSTFKLVIKKLLNSTQYLITEFLESNTTLLNRGGLYLALLEKEENKAEIQISSGNNNLREIVSIIGDKVGKYNGNLYWDKHITYRKAQKVIYLNDEWISLEDNNRGNLPSTSNLWLKSSTFSDKFRVKRLTSIVKKDDLNDVSQMVPGYVSPTVFTIPNVSTEVEFDITYLNGYKLSIIANPFRKIIFSDSNRPSLSDYHTYTSSDSIRKYKVNSDDMNEMVGGGSGPAIKPDSAVVFGFTRIKCPIVVIVHQPKNGYQKEYGLVNLKDPINLKRININTANNNLVKLEKEYYIDDKKVNSRILNLPNPYLAEDIGDGSSYIDIDDIADLPGTYHYNVYLEGIYYKISIINHIGFYVDRSEISIPKANDSSVTEVYRISPVNGILGEGIKYNITYLNRSDNKEYTTDTITYNPLDSSRINTVNGIVYTMSAVNNSYFNLKIEGNIKSDIKLNIWK